MTAIVVLGPSALPLARRLRDALPGSAIHGLRRRIAEADFPFDDAAAHIGALFASGTPVVGLCAAGILIRAVAPLLRDKRAEPPVVAVAEDGSSVVPLLGGHRGANALARRLAEAIGGHAAVTTAGDVALGIALDEPPPGWRIADPAQVKPVAAALLAGEPVALAVEASDAAWLCAADIRFASAGRVAIRVTDRRPAAEDGALVFHPPVLALGVGCERGCDPAELASLVEETLDQADLADGAVALVASLDLKLDEAAVHALAARLDVPARFFTAAELMRETSRLATPSETVFRETGCWGVAEGAALAAAGPEAALVVAKRKSARATCAVARSPAAIDPELVGRTRGTLAVVGIGPGDPSWRTPEASAALAGATDLVGYRLYLDLVGPLAAGKTLHDTGLGAEEARARHALDLAAEGKRVALVSSGDPGIYALATLVYELLDREKRADWRRVAVTVCPGISALQAAAARVGAPLGHDFCAISLSDLLTPWPAIEKRLRAAAEADFVVALYNPRSERRTGQLDTARRILLEHRPGSTPVVLARNLGRSAEQVSLTTLAELDGSAVDMLTLVLVGSSATRRVDGVANRLYTPRGYGTARQK
jgi:cobalt-precorrin 5A hydrolase/precorrin-3B C17-methyltransferase